MITTITIQEVARRLDVSESTIKRYIKMGELKAAKIGRAWRIREDAVTEFIVRREKAQSEPKLIEIK